MTAHHDKTDAQLVALALEDQDAFVPLVDRYEQKLMRYVQRFTGLGQQCAEDVLQEVFLKIYRNLNDFDPDLSFSSWAYRIAHNEAVNYLRKHRAKETAALETEDEDVVSLLDVLEADASVADEAARKELQHNVRKALLELSPKYREVLVLRYLEDKDYNEISDILKKPQGTVATLLNRAKAQFKKIADKNHYHFLSSDHE